MARISWEGRHISAGRKARKDIRLTTEKEDHFRGRQAEDQHGKLTTDEVRIFNSNNELIGYYCPKVPEEFQELPSLFNKTEFELFESKKELHFGMSPRHFSRGWEKGEFENNKKHEGIYSAITRIAERLQEKIERQKPKIIDTALQKLSDSYTKTIGDTYFNHAILMQNGPVPYHKDSPLFDGVWSILVVWSYNILGGEIVFPTLNLRFKPNGYFLFPSSELTHGVTNYLMATGGYRYSLLIYLDKNVLK